MTGMGASLLSRSVHLCVDMQRVFAEDTPWHTPWFRRVLPRVIDLCEVWGERTIFTRFVPPHEPDQRPGLWKRYFARWQELTLNQADPALFDLAPELARFAPPAEVIDKPAYSAFHDTSVCARLEKKGADTLIISGTETDVCVLGTALDAVDFGYRVIIAEDAICSSADTTHEAILTFFRDRLSEQVDVACIADLIKMSRKQISEVMNHVRGTA